MFSTIFEISEPISFFFKIFSKISLDLESIDNGDIATGRGLKLPLVISTSIKECDLRGIKIKLKLKPDGTVIRTEILNHERMNKPGQGFYKVLAESALRAIQLCQPLRVPTTGYEKWKDLQLNFDAREMLEG